MTTIFFRYFISFFVICSTTVFAQNFVLPIDAPTTEGLKPINPDEVLNQIDGTIGVGGGLRTTSDTTGSTNTWQNLYLAFAIDVRYRRECHAGKQTALCKFLHSGISARQSLTWKNSAPETLPSVDQNFEIIFIPIEYVTGSFTKSGPALPTTNSALTLKAGARAELVRELGLAIEHRFVGAASGSIEYASTAQPLSQSLAFRWVGSIRLFAGASSFFEPTNVIRPALGAETMLGLALDVDRGTILLSNTLRHDGDFNRSLTQNVFELKYLKAICNSAPRCDSAHIFDLGGGARYESLSFDKHDVQRLIFLIEINRL